MRSHMREPTEYGLPRWMVARRPSFGARTASRPPFRGRRSGELAVTVRTPVAVEGGYRDALSVHVVDVDTGSERTLDEIHVYDYVAAWSPDGSRLAFVGDDGHIRVSDRDDGSTARLSPRQQDGARLRVLGRGVVSGR